jgi:hypothetical protein
MSDACGRGCLDDCKTEDSSKEEGERASRRRLARSKTGAAANEKNDRQRGHDQREEERENCDNDL